MYDAYPGGGMGKAALVLGYYNRGKIAVTVTRDTNGALSMFGLYLLGKAAVPRIAAVITGTRVLFITRMGVKLTREHLL